VPERSEGDEGLMNSKFGMKKPSPASLPYRLPIRLGLSSPKASIHGFHCPNRVVRLVFQRFLMFAIALFW
jgi:hypothetical protein